jgi:hypothetical protein
MADGTSTLNQVLVDEVRHVNVVLWRLRVSGLFGVPVVEMMDSCECYRRSLMSLRLELADSPVGMDVPSSSKDD